MQKKNLFGIALLCASVFLFTGCKEIMSHFDNAVDSHLQVADKLTIIGVEKTYQIAKDVDYKTISDAAPEFTVDEASKGIVEVDKTTGVVKGLKSGDATIKISLPDNGLYLDATASITIKVRVEDTDQFNKNIERLADGDQILFAENAAVEVAEAVDLSGKKITIKGVENKPATITAKGGFTINSPLSLENVIIDASEVTTPFIQLATLELAEGEVSKIIEEIAFINSEITLKNQFIYANKQSYLVKAINVENSIIAVDGTNKKTTFDFNGGGNTELLSINKSTIFQNPTVNNNGGFFSSQSGKEVTDLGGETQTFSITNTTLYNITNEKTVNTLRKNSQTYQKFIVKSNIVVNCGKSAQFLKGLNAGQAGKDANWDVDGNCFNFGGSKISEQNIGTSDGNIKNSIDALVEFADAANGDFSQTGVNAGDPRWK